MCISNQSYTFYKLFHLLCSDTGIGFWNDHSCREFSEYVVRNSNDSHVFYVRVLAENGLQLTRRYL